MMIYLEVYTKDAIQKEVEYRVQLMIQDDTSSIVIDVMTNIENYYIDNMDKHYGTDNNLMYVRENVEYLISADTYRGVCYINSLKSYEYENMSSKSFKRRAKDIVQKMASYFKYYILTEKIRENIANIETKYLKKYSVLKYKDSKVSYSQLIKAMKDNEIQRRHQLQPIQSKSITPNEDDIDFEKKLKQSNIDEGKDFWASIGIDPDKTEHSKNRANHDAPITFIQKLLNIFR